MKKHYRKIVFSNSILTTSFRYENEFQVLPFNISNKPQCPYAKHFPLLLEYTLDFKDKEPNKMVKLTEFQINREKEILNLLSCLTNHRFFSYNSSMMGWGVEFPNKIIENMTETEKHIINNRESSFFIGGYIYNGLKEDLIIDEFTDYSYKAVYKDNLLNEYYTDNPIDDYKHEISFPATIYPALHSYYLLSDATRKKVDACIYLACDGIDISAHKRTLSFLSYVSAIEGLIGLEIGDDEIQFECGSCKHIKSSPYSCPICGRPIWGIKQKFIKFLSEFVAGSDKSKKIYSDIYNLRSKITHSGKLFSSDYELSFDDSKIEQENRDWLMRLKTLQLFRVSLDHWLRYTNKKKQ
jgi:hypothetical protein